jgi:hypothetical protein
MFPQDMIISKLKLQNVVLRGNQESLLAIMVGFSVQSTWSWLVYICGGIERGPLYGRKIKFWTSLQNNTGTECFHLPRRSDRWARLVRNRVKQLNANNQCFLSRTGPNSGSHVTKRTVLVVMWHHRLNCGSFSSFTRLFWVVFLIISLF